MTNFESDQELEDYLEGKDGVSDAYAELPDENPSKELDELILKAARDSVKKTNTTNGYLSGKYSIAASLVACILIASLYLGNNSTQQDETSSLSISKELMADNIEEIVISENRSILENQNTTSTTSSNRIVSGAETAGFAGIADRNNDTANTFSTNAEAVFDTQFEQQPASQPEPQITNAQRYRPEPVLEAPSPASAGISTDFATEEIIVTATRNFSDADIYYRDDPIAWLEELYYLKLEVEDAQAILNDERSAFSARYPGIDIDAALQEFSEE